MEDNQVELLGQKISRIAKIAAFFQCIAFVVAVSILYCQLNSYREDDHTLSFIALIATSIIVRVYIYNGKKLETIKKISPNKAEARKCGCFKKFFSTYSFWILFSSILSYELKEKFREYE